MGQSLGSRRLASLSRGCSQEKQNDQVEPEQDDQHQRRKFVSDELEDGLVTFVARVEKSILQINETFDNVVVRRFSGLPPS